MKYEWRVIELNLVVIIFFLRFSIVFPSSGENDLINKKTNKLCLN